MRGRTPFRLAIGTAAVALFAAGCTTTPTTPPVDPNADAGGELRIYASEPAFLVPTAADDDPSIQVIRQIYRGLVTYNTETGAAENDLAESISSTDNTNWTIKIKPGYKFTNGEAVNSDSFIRAWNYTAYGPNAQNNAYFMSRIDGIDDLAAGEDPDGDGPQTAPDPKSKELSGLKKVDDLTFTVKLSAAFSGFPATIGYSGFFPVAEACLANLDACNEAPIGNGPYKIEGSWQHDDQITLVRNDSWPGPGRGKADRLVFKIYGDVGPAYDAFIADDLDVMSAVPPAKVKEAKSTLGERFYERPGDTFSFLGFPLYNDNFSDRRIRQAFSMAIDRQAIIDAVFDGRFTAASGVVSPNFDGYRANICKYCKLDVTRAKSLLAAAGGWKGGKLELWAIAGAADDKWLQAVGDQIEANLGIEYELKVSLQLAAYRETANNRGFTGPFRAGWGPDYPIIETYLAPLYATDGSANSSVYSNARFDDLIRQGDAASTLREGITSYQQAEDIVVEDLPVIPLWFSTVTAVYGWGVNTFVYNSISGISYGEITLKK
jgi:ABC-type transport system substrate-binding protein